MPSFSIICVLIALICLYVGLNTLLSNKKRAGNRIFFLICLWIAALNILAVVAYSSKTKTEVVFWTHIVGFFAHTFFPLNLHFYVRLFRGKKLPSFSLFLLYGPMFLLMPVSIISHKAYYDFSFIDGKWKWIPETGSPWVYIYLSLVILYSVLTVFYILRYSRNSKSNREKTLGRLLIINYTITIITGIIFIGILPSIYKAMENIGLSYSLFYILGLFFAVFRYRFFTFRSFFVAEEIISHISDIVILVNPDYKIAHYNKKFSDCFPAEKNNFKGFSIFELTVENRDFRQSISGLSTEGVGRFNCRLDYISREETIPTDTYVSVITDNFHDVSGFIIISTISRNRNLFKKTFGITDREFDVIDLILNGSSNEDIGKKLGITERTVESHCLHIYNKTGTNDRIDLFRISAEYDLIPTSKNR